MPKLACLLALLTLALCRGAEADGVMIRGSGLQSCGTWTKAQGNRQVSFNDMDLAVQIYWVLGFFPHTTSM
jgi:hypothetical protein